MPDLTRGYRFWLLRRLCMLVPACTGAGLLIVHQLNQITTGNPLLWIHFACLSLAFLLLLFTGWLAGRCVACYLSHKNQVSFRKRRTRMELAQAGLMGMVCLALLPALSLLPATFQDLSRTLPTRLMEVSRLLKVTPEKVSVQKKPVSKPKTITLRPVSIQVNPAPPVPVQKTTPTPPKPLAVETQPAYVYSFQEEEQKADHWTFDSPPRMDRLGVPNPMRPFEWMLPEINVKFLALNNTSGMISGKNKTRTDLEDDLDMESAGFQIDLDLPVSRDDSILFLYQPVVLSAAQNLTDAADGELDDFLLWQRLGVFFAHRFVGYTSESVLDFSLMIGVVGDSLLTTAQGGVADEVIRLSPYLGMEVGLWQQGPAGILLNFSHTFPTNITGAAARVTQLSALFRIEFAQAWSLHMGYFGIRGRFQDFSGKMTWQGSDEEMEVFLHGPTFGIDLRF